jgi:hypothetical protein
MAESEHSATDIITYIGVPLVSDIVHSSYLSPFMV